MTKPTLYISKYYRSLLVVKKKKSNGIRGPSVRYYLYSKESNKAGSARLRMLQDFAIGSFVFKHLTGATASVHASARATNKPSQFYFISREPFLSWE
jgi:hypothetical protein